jgi:hypothetical protein
VNSSTRPATSPTSISGEDGSNRKSGRTPTQRQQLIKAIAAVNKAATTTYEYETDAAMASVTKATKKVIDARGNAVIYQYDARATC